MDEAAKEFMKMYHLLIEARNPSKEKRILSSKSKGLRSPSPSRKALEYAKIELEGNRWFKAEPLILKSPYVAIEYATLIIKDRWPELENLILSKYKQAPLEGDIYDKYRSETIIPRYTANVIKDRWPEAEHTMISNLKPVSTYGGQTLGIDSLIEYAAASNHRWPELEEKILQYIRTNPIDHTIAYSICSYASRIIKDRWKEVEPFIAKWRDASLAYAMNVIKGPWVEGEETILKNPDSTYKYSIYTKKRFIEAEPSMFQYFYRVSRFEVQSTLWERYVSMARERIPAIEELAIKNAETAYKYCLSLKKCDIFERMPEFEKAIKKSPKWAFLYAVAILKCRWPDAEPMISRDHNIKHDYESFFCEECQGFGYEETSGGERIECEDCFGGGINQTKPIYYHYYN